MSINSREQFEREQFERYRSIERRIGDTDRRKGNRRMDDTQTNADRSVFIFLLGFAVGCIATGSMILFINTV